MDKKEKNRELAERKQLYRYSKVGTLKVSVSSDIGNKVLEQITGQKIEKKPEDFSYIDRCDGRAKMAGHSYLNCDCLYDMVFDLADYKNDVFYIYNAKKDSAVAEYPYRDGTVYIAGREYPVDKDAYEQAREDLISMQLLAEKEKMVEHHVTDNDEFFDTDGDIF